MESRVVKKCMSCNKQSQDLIFLPDFLGKVLIEDLYDDTMIGVCLPCSITALIGYVNPSNGNPLNGVKKA